MIIDDYHNIGRLLLLTIIVSCKNWTILIIDKENITVLGKPVNHLSLLVW